MSQLPYQRLRLCGTTLIAARGSQIDTFDLMEGGSPYLSTWKYPSKIKSDTSKQSENGAPDKESRSEAVENGEESGPATKRRKLSNEDSAEAEGIKGQDTKAQNGKGKKKSSKPPQGSEVPNVILLACTGGFYNQHVVAVTGEDKTIRVFKLAKGGVLEQLSERVMPKRPCALSITADNTIICGDKFGDVYSLPLIPSPIESLSEDVAKKDSIEETPSSKEEKSAPYVPAANHLTIHTQRNLKALENQKRHIPQTKPKENTTPKFEYSLLLGHVSMLTDLALISIQRKNYILTADRDEHIRISRGIPQAHVIEGYCLGHKEFVSRICDPSAWNMEGLILSGGGDDEIFVWEVPEGKLVAKADLKSHVEGVMAEFKGGEEKSGEGVKVTVAGIYHLRTGDDLYGQSFGIICEGVPALFIYFYTTSLPEPEEMTPETLQPQTLTHIQTIPLKGNPLSLVTCNWNSTVIISIDNYFKAGSTTEVRSGDEKVDSLQRFMANAFGHTWREWETRGVELEKVKDDGMEVGKEVLSGLFYGLRNLRKEGKEEEDADGE